MRFPVWIVTDGRFIFHTTANHGEAEGFASSRNARIRSNGPSVCVTQLEAHVTLPAGLSPPAEAQTRSA